MLLSKCFFRSYLSLLLATFSISSAPSFASDSESAETKRPSVHIHIDSNAITTKQEIDENEILFTSSAPSKRVDILVDEKSTSEDEQNRAFVINQIHLLSSSLKIVDVAILLEETAPKASKTATSAESAEFSVTQLEEAGDIRNGLFLILESLHRPYRYHAAFLSFNETSYNNPEAMSFLGEATSDIRNKRLRTILKTSPLITPVIKATILTKTKPNKLLLAIEEDDKRTFPPVRNFFGRIHAKFEKDPFAMICLLAGGASRLTKAVMTNGASELAMLQQ